MSTQVATPGDSLASRGAASRRSILANMDPATLASHQHALQQQQQQQPQQGAQAPPSLSAAPDSASPPTPVSNTDALLRSRRSSQIDDARSTNSRRKSMASTDVAAPGSSPPSAANGIAARSTLGPDSLAKPANGNGLRHRTSNISQRSSNGKANGANGTTKEIESDRRSISSRRSSRGIISAIVRRGSRNNVADGDDEPTTGRRSRSGSISSRRLSVRMPSFGSKKSGGAANAAANASPAASVDVKAPATTTASSLKVETRDVPPVPPVPLEVSPKGSTVAEPVVANGAAAAPAPVPTAAKSAPSGAVDEGAPTQAPTATASGLVGGAVAAVAGVGAAGVGAASALAGKVTSLATGNAEASADDDSEDEFHDAELADIAEHDEEHEEAAPHGAVAPAEHAHLYGRHRGLSESTASELRDAQGAGTLERGTAAEPPTTSRPGSIAPSTTPSQLRGTSSAKRRSGSVPAGLDEAATPSDAKAKKETPVYVREKAARVAKLTYDDVRLSETELAADLQVARRALDLFLNSRMLEAEELMKKHSDRKLYYALGDALIAVIKGFMTFEPVDLAKAISYCKDAMHIASMLRKPSSSVASLGRFVRGTGISPSGMASMDKVQRHAELVYAESLLLKAVMGIIYSGDFFAFLSEALNMRNAYGSYRSLNKYVEWADEQARKKRGEARDESIDEDFRSGVCLGNGLISMILGLLPGKVLRVMEAFGYAGDTQEAMRILSLAGKWSSDPKELQPGMSVEKEGIRRAICDLSICFYHLVISTFLPVQGVDVPFADKVLHFNLQRYPNGVFFLYFSGRLYSTEALAEKAIVQYRAAKDCQAEYVQLHHICYWDMALCNMSLARWQEAYDLFTILLRESNWSKAVYNYGRAANLLSTGKDDAAAFELFRGVPGQMQRIAGRSIPMEKFCARKAKKAVKQNGRMVLPAIEFSYIYHCLTNAPRYALFDKQLVDISDALAELSAVQEPSSYHGGADAYWDDLCLVHFLRGVTLKYIAHPEPHARADPPESPIPPAEACQQAELSLRTVVDNGHKISLDHYLVYFSHYELGRLFAATGRADEARREFDLVMSGKNLEDRGRKGKYSMQNMCQLRTNGALQTLGKA